QDLGGPKTAAIGFALGVERLLLATSSQQPAASQKLVYVIALGDAAKKESVKLLNNLRKNGISSDTDYENKSLKAALRKANDLNARFVLIIGEDELKKGAVTLKDMVSGEQKEVKAGDIFEELKC
ncbi:MAG: His/Gly/Thr/Pro-type tRNA ligase C-terminal domain-containing protein, partial [Candidatus Omnitrophota bacterium]